MVGLVVVTHGRLGVELINTAELILGRIENSVVVSIEGQNDPDRMRFQIQEAIKQADGGHGVLILTDLFGGTPSNISLSFLSNGQVEVLSGVNLPMIIKLAQNRNGKTLAEVAQSVAEYGRKSINVAGEILNRKVKN
jgi:PTS system mannose-specific IIA component